MHRFEIGTRRRLFFLHVPKTAGTSLRSLLRNQYPQQQILPANDWAALARLPEAGIARYRLFQGHFTANARAVWPGDTETAMLLREPVSRLLSVLRHMQRDPHFHPLHHLVRDRTISEILRMPDVMELQRDVQTAILSASVPPSELLSTLRRAASRGEALEAWQLERRPDLALAKIRLAEIEHVGLTESFAPFVERLCREMDFHPPTLLPVLNAAQGPGDLSTLSAEDLDRLRSYNVLDLELYAFAEQLLRRRDCAAAMTMLTQRGLYAVQSESFAIDLAGPVPGSGWYDAEQEDGRSWRWTGPDQVFTLEVPLAPGMAFSCRIRFFPRNGWQSRAMSVQVDGQRVPVALHESDGAWTASFPIATGTTGCCCILFDAGPSATGPAGGDLRRLHLAVDRIAFDRLQDQTVATPAVPDGLPPGGWTP